MFKNYFKIAWRNLQKTKGYSAINIGGLAVGMAVALLIGLWMNDELSYNKFHSNYKDIALVMRSTNFGGQKNVSNSLPRPLEFELRNKYGNNFKHVVMSRWDEEHILTVGETKIVRLGKFMQDDAPEMFSLKMIEGDWNGLKDIHSIMISSSTAKAFFGETSALGKTIRMDNEVDVKVTGVYEDLPHNSEFRNIKFFSTWELVISRNNWMEDAANRWDNQSFVGYVQINPTSTFEQISSRIKNSMHDNVGESGKKFNNKIFLVPMSRWHLYSDWKNGVNVGGRIQFVWLFGVIGVFVLFLACINFMNLSTARSEKRAREVGVRKAIGSMRSQLINQFLCESFLVVIIAFVIALILVSVALPWFNNLADKKIEMPLMEPLFWLSSFTFILITSFVSGSYPAFYLSSFNPVKVLKGTFQAGRYSTVPRKVMVVLQFSVSVALIIGTFIVYRQIQHAKNRPVGYDRSGLLMVQIKSDDLRKKISVLSEQLKSKGIVSEFSTSSSPLTSVWEHNGGFTWKDKDPNKEAGFGTIRITHDYGKTIGWQVLEGRDFSKKYSSDSIMGEGRKGVTYSIIINEAAAKYMELEEPVGEIVKVDDQSLKIIGVVKDIVIESPYDPVLQLIYVVSYENASWINIRINPKLSTGDALTKIENVFKKVVPDVPFDYKFADTEYGLKFNGEERIGKLSSIFAGLAIFISCLGLFGLASFVAEKRTKEIGIRKVLGASLFNLWKMLSTDFIILVFISCLIAIPFTYYFLSQWLQQYEYRTEISWWIFVISIGGAILVTVFTVSFQAVKAAIANPVKSLRSE